MSTIDPVEREADLAQDDDERDAWEWEERRAEAGLPVAGDAAVAGGQAGEVGQDPNAQYADYLHAGKFDAAFLADLDRPGATINDLTAEEELWYAYGHMPSEHRERPASELAWWERDDDPQIAAYKAAFNAGAEPAEVTPTDPTTAAVEQCRDAVAAASHPSQQQADTARDDELAEWATTTEVTDTSESSAEDALGR